MTLALLLALNGPARAVSDGHGAVVHTGEAVQADIMATYGLLQRLHPNVDRHVEQGALEKLRDALASTIADSNTADAAFMVLSRLIGAVCDEHTQIVTHDIAAAGLPTGWPWFKELLLIRDGRLYLEQGAAKPEVLAINGVKGTMIATEIAGRLPYDGCLRGGTAVLTDSLPVSGPIFNTMVDLPDGETHYDVLLAGEAGPSMRRIAAVQPHALHHFRNAFFAEQTRTRRDVLRSNGFVRRTLEHGARVATIDHWHASRRDIAYVDIRGFVDLETAHSGIEDVMRGIITERPRAVILDLTNNPGGAMHTAQFLMAFLLPRAHRLYSTASVRDVSRDVPANFIFANHAARRHRELRIEMFEDVDPEQGMRTVTVKRRSFGKPDYKGKIYVLVSPQSRSAAIKVAATLKRLRQATIVGSVSASSTVSTCGAASGAFVLQHTGFALAIPELCFHSSENKIAEDGSLVPDVPIDAFDVELAALNSRILKAAIDHFDEHIGR